MREREPEFAEKKLETASDAALFRPVAKQGRPVLVYDLLRLAKRAFNGIIAGRENIGTDEAALETSAINFPFDSPRQPVLTAFGNWCGMDQAILVGLRIGGGNISGFRGCAREDGENAGQNGHAEFLA